MGLGDVEAAFDALARDVVGAAVVGDVFASEILSCFEVGGEEPVLDVLVVFVEEDAIKSIGRYVGLGAD